MLLNEAERWPDGEFVTTHLIVATSFLGEHPDVIRDLIAGLADAIDITNADSWENLEFTLDPIASSLQGSADDAVKVELLEQVDLSEPGIYDLSLLNEVLAERGLPAVEGL